MSDGIGSIGNDKKPQGLNAGAHLALNTGDRFIKKTEENPLGPAILPGGLFTHPSLKMS